MEIVQCIVIVKDVIFRLASRTFALKSQCMRLVLILFLLWLATRYFTAQQTLCMRYSYRRWRLIKGDWLLMDQDLRDEAISTSMDITI